MKTKKYEQLEVTVSTLNTINPIVRTMILKTIENAIEFAYVKHPRNENDFLFVHACDKLIGRNFRSSRPGRGTFEINILGWEQTAKNRRPNH